MVKKVRSAVIKKGSGEVLFDFPAWAGGSVRVRAKHGKAARLARKLVFIATGQRGK